MYLSSVFDAGLNSSTVQLFVKHHAQLPDQALILTGEKNTNISHLFKDNSSYILGYIV